MYSVLMQSVFWFSLCFIIYAYVGYPFLLKILAAFINRPVRKGDITPTVAFIVAAYNEEKHIREKIENTLKQDYPPDRLEVIVASDCSTDSIDAIVKSYASHGIRLVRAAERWGKEVAQELAVNATQAEILVFSDVATSLSSDGISSIVKNFFDPSVGCVSSVDCVVDAGGKKSGEGAYVKYEMCLRNLETRVNTLVGLSGSLFAARREVCQDWATGLQSDFNTLLNTVKVGLRGVSDPTSIGFYKNLEDEQKEFERKVRTVLRGISVVMNSLPLLNPFQYRLFAWQLFSHKICRWLVPFAMVLAFVSSGYLMFSSPVYVVPFAMQFVLYAIGLGGMWLDFSKHRLLNIPAFLVIANVSILNAWYRYLKGERLISWTSSER